MVLNQISKLQDLKIDPEMIMAALPRSLHPLTTFLSGSVIEGHANTESDLDVFLVVSDSTSSNVTATYNLGTTKVIAEYTDDWRLDIEIWLEGQISQVAQRLSSCKIDEWDDCVRVPRWYIEFIHHVRTGIPISGAEYFKKLWSRFDYARVSKSITTRCLADFSGVAEDTSGAIMSKQYGAALLSAREALHLAVDAMIAAYGETNLSGKWRFAKLEKIGNIDLLERYWQLEGRHIKDRDAAIEYAKECLMFSNQLIIQAQKMNIQSE